jgi:hypothetical protein
LPRDSQEKAPSIQGLRQKSVFIDMDLLAAERQKRRKAYFKRRINKIYFEWGSHTNTKDGRS